MTRILFATDLHGSRQAYAELLSEAERRAVQGVVLGGDLLPHGRGSDPVAGQTGFLREVLRPTLAAFRDRGGCRVFAMLGNDDFSACLPELERMERDRLWVHVHRKAVALGEEGWSIAGCSFVPVTPFWISDFDRFDHPGWWPPQAPDEILLSGPQGLRSASLDELLSRPTIQEEIERLARLSDPARTLYVFHTPPHGTALDRMAGGVHVGSLALRRFLEERQPPLSLHGHIHESPARSGRIAERLGQTLAVNPGASLAGLRAVELDLDDPGEVELLTPGE